MCIILVSGASKAGCSITQVILCSSGKSAEMLTSPITVCVPFSNALLYITSPGRFPGRFQVILAAGLLLAAMHLMTLCSASSNTRVLMLGGTKCGRNAVVVICLY